VASSTQTVYCIDTSALIELDKTYPPSVFAGLWSDLESLVAVGRLLAPAEVRKEIQSWDVRLFRWARQNKRMFVRPAARQLRFVAEVISEFPGLVEQAKQPAEADPFVIALALAKREGSLFRTDHVVVSMEKRSSGRPKIPNVCDHYGIEHIAVADMFEKEGWCY